MTQISKFNLPFDGNGFHLNYADDSSGDDAVAENQIRIFGDHFGYYVVHGMADVFRRRCVWVLGSSGNYVYPDYFHTLETRRNRRAGDSQHQESRTDFPDRLNCVANDVEALDRAEKIDLLVDLVGDSVTNLC